jgi:hypothetical protein
MALEELGDGILGGLREEDVNNSLATRTQSKQSLAEQSPLALFQGFVMRKARESGSSEADVYDMLKTPSTRQPTDPVNVQYAVVASTSAEQDIVDQFAIVAKPKLHNKYSDGDDDYCPSPLDRYSEMGLIKSNVNYDDDSAFADKDPEEEMSHYCDDEEKGRRGRKLTEGGPEKTDVSHLDPGRAAAVMKIWQSAQKKFTNSIATKETKRRHAAMKRGDQLSDVVEYTGTGVVADLWRSMWKWRISQCVSITPTPRRRYFSCKLQRRPIKSIVRYP